jgi:ribosomal protein S18 acetylase RimI-like enzyme
MNHITIRQAQAGDFEIIAKLIVDQNKNPETHCIQSDTGSDYQSVQNEIVRLDSGVRFVSAFQNDQFVGTLGCELDEELGRGWVRGPFIVKDTGDWEHTASALLQGLEDALPPAIHMLDSFLNIENKQGNDFYLAHGFRELRLVHVYVAASKENLTKSQNICVSLEPHQSQNFIVLHETVFPQTYATGQRILDKLGNNHKIFVYPPSDEILGYVYAALEEDSGDGSIEFIGVRENARGQGIGRQLLQAALQWLFEEKKVSQVMLVVNDNLTNARSLYESVGFRLKYTGLHARKEW